MSVRRVGSLVVVLGVLIGGTIAALHAQSQLKQPNEIDANARSEEAVALLSSLGPDSRQAIRQSVVPVFLPRSASSSIVSVQARENSTLVHVESVDYQLSLKATKAQRDKVRTSITSTEPINRTTIYDRNEVGLWYATWAEADTAYRMVLECREASQPLCTDASLIRALVADLILIGGAGER